MCNGISLVLGMHYVPALSNACAQNHVHPHEVSPRTAQLFGLQLLNKHAACEPQEMGQHTVQCLKVHSFAFFMLDCP